MTSLPGKVSKSGRQSRRGNFYEPSNESKKQYDFFIMVKKYLHEWPEQSMSELETKYNELLKQPITYNQSTTLNLQLPTTFNELKGGMDTSTFLKEGKLDFEKLDKVFPKEPNGEFLSELDEFDYGREENINDFRIKIYPAEQVKKFLSVVPNKLFFIPDGNGSIQYILNDNFLDDDDIMTDDFLEKSLEEPNLLTLGKLPKADSDHGKTRSSKTNVIDTNVIPTKKILPVIEGYDIKDMHMIAQKILDWQKIIMAKRGGGPIQPSHAFAAAMNHYESMNPSWPSDENGYYTKSDGQLHEDLQRVIYKGDGLSSTLEEWMVNLNVYLNDTTIFGNIHQHGDKKEKSDYTLFKEFLKTFNYGKHLQAAYNAFTNLTTTSDIKVYFETFDRPRGSYNRKITHSNKEYSAKDLATERYKSLLNFPSRVVQMIPGLLVRHINYTVFQNMEGPLNFYKMASNIMYGNSGGNRHMKHRTCKRNQRKTQKRTKNKRATRANKRR